ncbi:hypothetical protein MY1884_005959 [Beauveria asiatica]
MLPPPLPQDLTIARPVTRTGATRLACTEAEPTPLILALKGSGARLRHPTLGGNGECIMDTTHPWSSGVSPHLKRDFSDLSGYSRPTDERNAGYKNVNALLLCWQGDSPAKYSLLRVRQIFESNYGFRTEAFEIPVTKNPSVMLASPLAAFLREANRHQFLIIYYKGYGSYDSSGHQYWAPTIIYGQKPLKAHSDPTGVSADSTA